MTDLEIDFWRHSAKRSNELHREAAREFHRLLLSFIVLGLLLLVLTLGAIALGWNPGGMQ